MHPQPETYWGNVNTLGPRSCYDEGKRVAETMCYSYHRCDANGGFFSSSNNLLSFPERREWMSALLASSTPLDPACEYSVAVICSCFYYSTLCVCRHPGDGRVVSNFIIQALQARCCTATLDNILI